MKRMPAEQMKRCQVIATKAGTPAGRELATALAAALKRRAEQGR